MNEVIKVSGSPEETAKIANEIASSVKSPLIIGLVGELGAGKTCFAKGFAEGLGVKELVTSPTFLGISEYYSGSVPLVHMDFYKKVVPKYILEEFLKKDFIILIEWANNFEDVFKQKLAMDISVFIEYLRDEGGNLLNNKRQITVKSFQL